MDKTDSNIKLIVLFDFSKVSYMAVELAVYLAKKIKTEIHVVHFIKENKNAGSHTSQSLSNDLKLVTEAYELEGLKNIFSYALNENLNIGLKKIQNKIDANFVICGINQANHSQHISLNKVLGNFNSLSVPFILINEKWQKPGENSSVLLPINHTKEAKENIYWACYLGKKINSKIVIGHEKSKSKEDINSSNNLALAVKLIEDTGIEYQKHDIKKSVFRQGKNLFRLVDSENIDFVIFQPNLSKSGILKYSLKSSFLNNSNAAILLIKPRENIYKPCF